MITNYHYFCYYTLHRNFWSRKGSHFWQVFQKHYQKKYVNLGQVHGLPETFTVRSFKCPLMSYYEALSSEKPWHTSHYFLNMFRRLRQTRLYQNHLAQSVHIFINCVSHVVPEVSNLHQFPSFRPSYLAPKRMIFLQERVWFFKENPRRSARWHH